MTSLRKTTQLPRPSDKSLFVDEEQWRRTLEEARRRQPIPVIWLLGKTQAGKSSIVHALTGSPYAEIGDCFKPCTRTARVFDFPDDAPVVRFLDTRGLGERSYDPTEDLHFCESRAQLVLGVTRATDHDQEAVFEVLRGVRKRHPDWGVVIAQTGLHEAYAPDQDHVLPYPFGQEPWPNSLPTDLVRALVRQRASLGELPGESKPHWVPLDVTLPEDGFQPVNYGLEQLLDVMADVCAFDLRARLRADMSSDLARRAHPHVMGYAGLASTVGAIPLIDLVGVPSIQAKLLHRLAQVYDLKWDNRKLAEFIGILGVGVGTGYLVRLLVRELVKLVPLFGQTAGAFIGATASFAYTYAIGKTACYYFGATRLGEIVDKDALRKTYKDAFDSGLETSKPRKSKGVIRG